MMAVFMKYNMTQRGAPMRAGIETSSARRASLNSWFEAEDTLKALNRGVAFAYCVGGLEACRNDGGEKYRYIDRHSHDWVCCISTCRDAGINTPFDMAEGDKHDEDDDTKEEDAPPENQPIGDLEAQENAKREQPPAEADSAEASGAKKPRTLGPSGTI